jgi:hypothetical protein
VPPRASAIRAPDGPESRRAARAGSYVPQANITDADAPQLRTAIVLAPGISLLLDGAWQFDDLGAIRAAAGPLVAVLSAAKPSPLARRADTAGVSHSHLEEQP